MKRVPIHLFVLCFILLSLQASAQRAYYWQGGASGDYSDPNNWNTIPKKLGDVRNSPNPLDTLIFDGTNTTGGNNNSSTVIITLTNFTEESIAYLMLIPNTAKASNTKPITVIFPNSAKTLTITHDLLLGFNATLNIADNKFLVGGHFTSGNFNNGTATSAKDTSAIGGKIVLTGTDTSSYSIVIQNSPLNVGTGYTSAPTVTVGNLWNARTYYTAGTQVASGVNLYTVITSGTSSSIAPSHRSGTALDSTAELTWVGFAARATCGFDAATGGIKSLGIASPGSGYNSVPTLTFSGGGGTGAVATVTAFKNTIGVLNNGSVELDSKRNYALSVNLNIAGSLSLKNTNDSLYLCGKTISLNGVNGVGGDVLGNGVVVSTPLIPGYAGSLAKNGSIAVQGTGNPSVGKINTVSSPTYPFTNFTMNRVGATVSLENLPNKGRINFSGTLALTAGTVNDDGNTLSFAGNPAISGNGTHVSVGRGRLLTSRTTAGVQTVTSGTPILGNIEIGGSATTIYNFGAGTTINDTLFLTTNVNTTTGLGHVQMSDGAVINRSVGSIDSTPITLGKLSVVYSGKTKINAGAELKSSLENLTINDSAGVYLQTSVIVNNTLALMNGKLNIPPTMFVQLSSGKAIAGNPSSKSYIVTSSDLQSGAVASLRIQNMSNTATLFPIGDSSYYLPAIVECSNVGGDFSLNAFKGVTNNGTVNGTMFSKVQTDNIVNATWKLENKSSTVPYTLTLGWPQELEGSNFKNLGNSIGISNNKAGTWTNIIGTGNYSSKSVSSTFSDASSFYGIGALGTVLPISIKQLSVSLNNNKPMISWKTENEMNVAAFEVQSSTDLSNFSTIGTLSSGKNNYVFLDENYSEGNKVHYRLKITELTGKISFSSIISLNKIDIQQLINIYPNPILNNQLNIMLDNLTVGDYEIVINNILGQTIGNYRISYSGGKSVYSYSLKKSGYTGNYIINLFKGGSKLYSKMLTQN